MMNFACHGNGEKGQSPWTVKVDEWDGEGLCARSPFFLFFFVLLCSAGMIRGIQEWLSFTSPCSIACAATNLEEVHFSLAEQAYPIPRTGSRQAKRRRVIKPQGSASLQHLAYQ
jgi:hypothetical protein